MKDTNIEIDYKKIFVKKFDFLLIWFEERLVFITCIALLLLTFLIFFDVLTRLIFNTAIHGANETTELIMPYITFLPLAYALYKNKHIHITMVRHIVPNNIKRLLDIISSVLGLAFTIMILYKSFNFFWSSFAIREQMLAMVRLPWYVGKFAIFLGYIFFSVNYLLNIAKCLFMWNEKEFD